MSKVTALERRPGESILIGHSIEVLVEEVDGDRVRLRCWTPSILAVSEREVFESVASENRKAALSRRPTVEDLCRLQGEE